MVSFIPELRLPKNKLLRDDPAAYAAQLQRAVSDWSRQVFYGVFRIDTDQTVITTGVLTVGALAGIERSTDPGDPVEGRYVIWMSDGTAAGDDGDLMIKLTAGGVTKTGTLVDHSAL